MNIQMNRMAQKISSHTLETLAKEVQEPFSVRVTRPLIQGSSESLHTLTS